MRGHSNDQTLFLPRFAVAEETRYSARYRWSCLNRGPDPFVIFQWTQSGRGIFRFGGHDHPVPTGSAFVAIVPEDAEYRFEQGAAEPWRFAWLNFYGALALQLWGALRSVTGPVLALPIESAAAQSFGQLITNVSTQRFTDHYEASAAGFAAFMTLCRQLNAPSSALPTPDRTAATANRITAIHTATIPAGVKSLAAEVGVTREHFSRVFKSRHGESPGKFLRLQRIHAAREMLAATGLPLKEIALRCGFSSARHLTGAFRAMPPPPAKLFGPGKATGV